uniref:Uncharacterized protein n=1 Tax=Oryza sativa subsp. japonica TaxID=39947 RepID=Q69X18_ORYSJ|nr:hypothetical protein [Oryza sativa Japonica Group]
MGNVCTSTKPNTLWLPFCTASLLPMISLVADRGIDGFVTERGEERLSPSPAKCESGGESEA